MKTIALKVSHIFEYKIWTIFHDEKYLYHREDGPAISTWICDPPYKDWWKYGNRIIEVKRD